MPYGVRSVEVGRPVGRFLYDRVLLRFLTIVFQRCFYRCTVTLCFYRCTVVRFFTVQLLLL